MTAVLCTLLSLVGVAVLLVGTDDEVRTDPAPVDHAPTELVSAASMISVPSDTVAAPADTRDWLRSYQESVDDFALAEELAAAALLGDARAHYVLGELLLRCEVQKRTLTPYKDGTVAERTERYIAEHAVALEHSRQRLRTEASRCERLFFDDPFVQFDLPDEARDFRYWSKRSADMGDPIAVMNRTLRLAAGHDSSDIEESEREFRHALLSDVRVAISSREPAALFMVGTLFSQPAITTSMDMGLAWHVAACEAGYDCSNANPDFGFGCIEAGTCVAGLTYADLIQRDLGAAKYAEIYANAQDIQYKIKTDDWDGLQQYLKIK